MAGDYSAKLSFSVDFDAGDLPQFTVSRDGQSKYPGAVMGNGFIDDKELAIAVDLQGTTTPQTFHTKDSKAIKLMFRRMPPKQF